MKKKLPLIFLLLILALAAFLRIYQISDYLTFLGDEGRDVLIAKGILEGNFTLLGPRASAGDFFLGPIYYYMIAPFLWISNYDPVGPAIMVALVGVATTWLTYYIGKKWFNELAGLLASALYAVSPVVINYSRSSWNPNVLPFFALLTIYLLFVAVDKKKGWKYFLSIGFLLGIALQLHYLALFLCVIVATYLFCAQLLEKKRFNLLLIIKQYTQIWVGFLLGFSPFLLFEVRHGFPNIKTISNFIFADTLTNKASETGATFFQIISDVSFRVFARLVFNFPSPDRYQFFSPQFLQIFSWSIIIISLLSVASIWFVKNKRVVLLVYLWLFLGILFFGFYKKPIYDYYFTFFFPLPFLIFGNFCSNLMLVKRWKILGILAGITLFTSIFLYNLYYLPFRYLPNKQKEQVKVIAEAVVSLAGDKPYNFALISKGNSDHAYRYYLEVLGQPPVAMENIITDPERKTVTKQLLVVCEDITCQPLGNSLFEVAGFGRAEIVAEKDVRVVKVFKLIPYTEKKE